MGSVQESLKAEAPGSESQPSAAQGAVARVPAAQATAEHVTAVHQQGFDSLGPTVHSTVVASGREVNFIDEGDAGWQPLLFLGGAGTTVRAFGLLEFARSLREQLQVRVLSVERNGLGQTPFNPTVGFAEYSADVWSLLDSLGIDKVSVVAISGGGPYAAQLAAAHPGRVRSLHLACAFSEYLDGPGARYDVAAVAADPVAWWKFPADSPVHRIPGFDDSVVEEATRGVFARGRDVAPEGLVQAFDLYSTVPLPELGAVHAPAFLYWGRADSTVPLAHLKTWRSALPNVIEERIYDGEGHDVQYRHWDQILADVAHLGGVLVVNDGGNTILATPGRAQEILDSGGSLGLAAWG
ncbi:alpha/beta hydrolase [Arthrobacter sp. H14-L1]|nr:alpha/beta hydrolase [Arthrobacter sp. H14-L1]